MPELPEVETIVRQLQKTVVGRKITGAWSDWPNMLKTHTLAKLSKDLAGRKIIRSHRRAKYILLDLSGAKTLIIHQKISGHLLYGTWQKGNGKHKWLATQAGPLRDDSYNRFIRFMVFLDNGKMIGLADVRRFGRIYLGDTKKIEAIHDLAKLGPEPLAKYFTLARFKQTLENRRGHIKKVLMDPYIIVGIGNIYSDEILWRAGIHPQTRVENLKDTVFKNIYAHMQSVLQSAIKARGDSDSDYRTLTGEKGKYQTMTKAYHHTGEKCGKNDGGIIQRLVMNGRSAHFCPKHQKLH